MPRIFKRPNIANRKQAFFFFKCWTTNDSSTFLHESTHTIYHHFHLSSHTLGFCSYQHFSKWIIFILVMIPVLQPLGLTKKSQTMKQTSGCQRRKAVYAICKKVNWKTSELKNSSPASKPFSRNHYAISFVIRWIINTGIQTRMWFWNHPLITTSLGSRKQRES